MSNVGIIILAAGGSSRLGKPKQLLAYQGRSLILRAVETALASNCRPVIVVLGAYSERIKAELINLPVTIVLNPNWQAGMGSSIKTGFEALAAIEAAQPVQTDAALVMLGDQPFITSGFLEELAQTFSFAGGIVASAYNNTLGVPAVFGKTFYPELVSLSPAQGAKCLFERHADKVHEVDFPEGGVDIDTAEDYEELLRGPAQENLVRK